MLPNVKLAQVDKIQVHIRVQTTLMSFIQYDH